FTDSVAVRLAPPAEAPQATLYYFIGALGPFRFADSLVLRESATLKAIAISGSQYSDTAQWEFRRRLEAPRAAPRTRSFPDTLRVSFTSRVGDASIRYTADGSDPTPASPPFPAQGLLLDSTTVIKAIAVKGSDVSAIASETYTLVPDAPSASPRGGDYGSSITVQLSSRSARAAIYFTLDGTTPGPERGLPAYSVPFRLDTSAALKAVAVAGQGANMQRSAYLIENYTFIRPGSRVLGPGQRLDLSSNYSLVNPLPGAAPVDVEVLAADGLKNLKGFRDILFGIRLSVPDGSAAFPKVVFNAPAGETRLLYSLNPSGTARFLTAGDTSEITAPGTYFMAVDTLAPTITYSGEPFTEEDSTRLIVSIQDNVSNLLLDLERSDKPEAGFTGREITNAMLLTTSLKNPEGALRPLTIRLKVDDHSRKTLFPADGDAYPLAQRSTKPVRTPAAFRIGSSADNPWDLIAIPLALEPPLTLAQLRKNNSAPGLEGVSLNAATGAYRRLDENEPLPPGAAVWMAAPSSLPSMLFPALQTAGHRGSAGYRLTLRKGWNLVSNPTLDTLYWPVTRAYPESYDASRLKGLHAWNAGTREYEPAELLDPWRGYFAYYKGGRDTTVDLLSRPVPAPAPSRTGPPGAKSAAGSAGFTFRLSLQGWGRGSGAAGLSLRLGATATAENGLGVEDEPQPPSPKDDGPRLFSDRGNLRLGTDLVRWTQGNLYAWKVVAGLPARADSSAGSMRILGSALPEGHGAWAVSRKRGLRFPLGAGAEARPGPGSAEGIPMYPGFTDSLEVIAGPIAELEARLGTIPLAAGAFAARVSAWPGSLALDLRLPRAARLRMSLWSLDGRILERATLDLPQGIYHLVRNRGGRGYAPGLYVLALEWAEGAGAAGPRGSEGPRNLSLKIAIP
ncbi:MAG TPA: chitobiase/beta-hexosaminidase C-terminal domain-containing protein, partial [Fibrobacteria bacterium]|nr:chitobiase/beta-hexosaminidase C-terminal domain-containing protein [Fibrobacteria bacterium]